MYFHVNVKCESKLVNLIILQGARNEIFLVPTGLGTARQRASTTSTGISERKVVNFCRH